MNDAVQEVNQVSGETPSLVDYVSSTLANSGHSDPARWTQGLHPDAFNTNDFGTQRFLVNRQLRMLIGEVPENTTQIRFCLVESGTQEDWCRLFQQMVLPCMLKYNIPQATYQSPIVQ